MIGRARSKAAWWLLAAAVYFSAAPRALLMVPISLADMAAKSDYILLGSVAAKTCERDAQGRIYTRVEFQIEEAWKGRPPSNPFVVVQAGGILGRRCVVAPGQAKLDLGERAVLFLVKNKRGEGVILGLAQGKFRVWTDEQKRCRAASIFIGEPPGANAGERAGASSGALTLDDLRQRVERAVR